MTPEPSPAPSTIRFAIGAGFGLLLGFFLGIALNDFGLGVPLGLAAGLLLVWVIDRVRSRRDGRQGSP